MENSQTECTDDTTLYSESEVSQFSGSTEDWSNSYTYLPTNFLGLNLKDLGSTKNNIFWLLKCKIDSVNTSFEDRTQGVRYLMRSPYIHAIAQTTDSTIKIIDMDEYNVYSRYFFFSNNEKYLRLNDQIVHNTHPHWFLVSESKKHPIELTMLSCRFLLHALSPGDEFRHRVLEYILDIIESNEYSDSLKADACDILITCGEFDEIDYGQAKLKKLITLQNSNPNDVYNSQSVHNSSFTESAIKILRALRHKYTPDNTIDFLKDIIVEYATIEQVNIINKFFYRALTDTTRFNQYTILDCLYLIGKHILELENEYKNTAIKRLIEELLDAQDTCSTGYLVRIVNVLSGLTDEPELVLKLDPKEELKCVINTRLSDVLQNTPNSTKESILEAIDVLSQTSSDEDAQYTIKSFINYSMLYDDLQDDYIGQKLLTTNEFDTVWKNTIAVYFGAQIF